jgi:hypothetical protein
MAGVGFGLMYIPAIVAVAEHFNKRRSLAIGETDFNGIGSRDEYFFKAD